MWTCVCLVTRLFVKEDRTFWQTTGIYIKYCFLLFEHQTNLSHCYINTSSLTNPLSARVSISSNLNILLCLMPDQSQKWLTMSISWSLCLCLLNWCLMPDNFTCHRRTLDSAKVNYVCLLFSLPNSSSIQLTKSSLCCLMSVDVTDYRWNSNVVRLLTFNFFAFTVEYLLNQLRTVTLLSSMVDFIWESPVSVTYLSISLPLYIIWWQKLSL